MLLRDDRVDVPPAAAAAAPALEGVLPLAETEAAAAPDGLDAAVGEGDD